MRDVPPNVLITTVPFGQVDQQPLQMLEAAGVEYRINPLGRRLTELELADMARDVGVLIAGTEPITSTVMDRAPNLRLISRVGIGLDNVDLLAARERGIEVCYTPDAPAPAVAELTIGLMLAALRSIPQADRHMRDGRWQRVLGRRLGAVTVGIVGAGRVGSRVIRLLQAFGARVLANDLSPVPGVDGVTWVSKEQLFAEADVISLHVPLTAMTRNLVDEAAIGLMRPTAVLVNTSRGGVVSETAVVRALRAGRLGAAAVDVFEIEPYHGELTGLDQCTLTCHMGSMSEDCRRQMEIEATANALAFIAGGVPPDLVPAFEYELRQRAETCL